MRMIRFDDQGRRTLIWILAGSFLLRLVSVPLCHFVDYTSDEKEYLKIAQRIVHEGRFIDSDGERSKRSPLFPAFLAALEFIFGENKALMHGIGCLLGVLCVALVYVLTNRLFRDNRAALFAAGAIGIYPGAVIYSALLQNETLFIVLVLLAMISGYHAVEKHSVAAAAIMGVVSGFAALTRAMFFGAFPFILASFLLTGTSQIRNRASIAGIALILFCAVVAPWTVRNYSIHGSFIPVSSYGGQSFLVANNPYATGTWRVLPGFDEWFVNQAEQRGIARAVELPEARRDSLSREIAVDYIRGHPAAAASMALTRIHMFWIYPITHTDSHIPIQTVAAVSEVILFFVAAIGLLHACASARALLPIAVFAGLLFLTHVGLHAEARYRLPLYPFLCMLFGAGVSFAYDSWLDPVSRNRLLRACAIMAFLLAVVYGYTAWLFFTHRIS